MNALQTFDFEANTVRSFERDGTFWFVAVDVCRALNLTNSRVTLQALDADEKGVSSTDTPGGKQQLATVSEGGLYTIILRCRDATKPGSVPHRFRKWVTGEVLPALRRTGQYGSAPAEGPALDYERINAMTNLIGEARRVHGRAAARALWGRLPLPQIQAVEEEGRRAATDTVADFIRGGCKVTGRTADQVTVSDLYKAYVAWCGRVGRTPIQATTFNRRMPKIAEHFGLEKGKSSVVRYAGIVVRHEPAPDE